VSGFDPTLDPKPVLVRRLEVLTGVGGRRRWSADDKARIVEETLAPGATVSEVARRHDIRPQQLFGWRRGMRTQEPAPPMSFVPALIESPPAQPRPKRPRQRGRRRGDGGIELEIDGVVMRVARGADAKTVAAVIRALKAEP
jgi:transposase